MTKMKILALLAGMVLLLAIPATALAQQQPPARYGGTVTLDGETAADGAEVTAWVGLNQVASDTVEGGRYFIEIAHSDGDGNQVSFQVDGNEADQSVDFKSGILRLNLNAFSSTRDCADVFADLIAAGVLSNVFRYDNATKTWLGYNPAVPELSDLETVDVFDSLWVEVTGDTEFQDQPLTAGWNSVTVRR